MKIYYKTTLIYQFTKKVDLNDWMTTGYGEIYAQRPFKSSRVIKLYGRSSEQMRKTFERKKTFLKLHRDRSHFCQFKVKTGSRLFAAI